MWRDAGTGGTGMTELILLFLGVAVAVLWRRQTAMLQQMQFLRLQLPIDRPATAQTGWDASTSTAEDKPQAVPNEDRTHSAVPAVSTSFAPIVAKQPAPGRKGASKRTLPKFETPTFKLPSIDFENLFGRLLPIWAGGVALAVAGFFLVRYSIAAGFFGPTIRVALGFVFGAGLIAAAELAHRNALRIADPRVGQVLAGAGLATLYGAFYMAGTRYDLVGTGIAFAGMAAATAAAIGLSFRFGLPSAIIGLVGGFAAPLLVSNDDPNLGLLSLYLALVTAGLSKAGANQGRSWLALASLAGGLGWGALILISGITGLTDIVVFGGYLVLLGAVIPAFTQGPNVSPMLRAGIGAVAAAQMAAMVALSSFTPMAWALYLLLGAALTGLVWRDARLQEGAAFAGLTGLFLLGLWTGSTTGGFLTILAAMVGLFIAVPAIRLVRGNDAAIIHVQVAALALGFASVGVLRFMEEWSGIGLATMPLAVAVVPLAVVWYRYPDNNSPFGWKRLLNAGAAAMLLAAAAVLAVPAWAAPVAIAPVAMGLVVLAWRRDEHGLLGLCVAAVAATLIALVYGLHYIEAERLMETDGWRWSTPSVLRWLALLAPPLMLALRNNTPAKLRGAMEALAVVAFYGLLAQVLSALVLPWAMVALIVALLLSISEGTGRFSVTISAAALAGAWALVPLVDWFAFAVKSLAGAPMLTSATINAGDAFLRIMPFGAALVGVAWQRRAQGGTWPLLTASALATLTVGAHIVFKQVFAIESAAAFVTYGLAERTVWQAILLAGAVAVLRIPQDSNRLATVLAATALAHFTLYGLWWHNPLTSAQAVGLPVGANLLTASYAVGFGALYVLRVRLAQTDRVRRALDGGTMLLATLFALSALRHVFAGTILLEPPVGQTEDLLRSLLGIVMAVGFLLWSSRAKGRGDTGRTWRIGSLMLMLLAVLKVFLFDAAGLEGLMRVASFMALGFSLIGIGWFYTRQLAASKPPPETAV